MAEAVQTQVGRVLEKTRAAIVRVEASDQHSRLAGTGFFVDPAGLLYTTWSTGGDTHDLTVVMGDRRLPARRLAADERAGIALLKVEAQTEFLPIGRSATLPVGSLIMTIGYPLELPLSPSLGLLGGFDRAYLGAYFATTHLRANVPVQSGEMGAPLLNMRGEVVGIMVACLGGGGSFALPVEAAEKIRSDYVRFGEARPAWLGISMQASGRPGEPAAARISDVFPNAPGHRAGLEPEDIIVELGRKPIHAPEDMLDACFFLSAGDAVPMRIRRGEEEKNFVVQTGSPPRFQPPAERPLGAEFPVPSAEVRTAGTFELGH